MPEGVGDVHVRVRVTLPGKNPGAYPGQREEHGDQVDHSPHPPLTTDVHTPGLHACVRVAAPAQGEPPYAGEAHGRVDVCTPPPHDTVQGP